MKLGIVTIPRKMAETSATPVIEQVVSIAQSVEKLGFGGLWVTDAFARGFHTMDPLVLLGVLAATTKTIELGTCVVQLPLRHPVEHAHRVQTLNLLTNGRLRFGIGSGSTKADFDAIQGDFEARFKTLPAYLAVMQRVWNGEAVYGPAISVWPGTEGGPPVMLGAWRSERWINLAAHHCQGWIASGIHGSYEDLELGIKMYREQGGKRVILANGFTDFRPDAVLSISLQVPKITLQCAPAEAKERLKRLEGMGVDDVLCVVPADDPGQLETIRGLI